MVSGPGAVSRSPSNQFKPFPTRSPSRSAASSGNDIGMALGLSIGIGIPAVLAVATLIWWWQRHREKSRKRVTSGIWDAPHTNHDAQLRQVGDFSPIGLPGVLGYPPGHVNSISPEPTPFPYVQNGSSTLQPRYAAIYNALSESQSRYLFSQSAVPSSTSYENHSGMAPSDALPNLRDPTSFASHTLSLPQSPGSDAVVAAQHSKLREANQRQRSNSLSRIAASSDISPNQSTQSQLEGSSQPEKVVVHRDAGVVHLPPPYTDTTPRADQSKDDHGNV